MRLKRGRPVVTEEPTLVVDGVPVGEHVFTLVVEGAGGVQSAEVRTTVRVTESGPPPPSPEPLPTEDR